MNKELSTKEQKEGELREKPWPQGSRPDLEDREYLWLRGVHEGLALLESWIADAILKHSSLDEQRILEWIRRLKGNAEAVIIEHNKIRLLAFDPQSE